MFFLCVEGVSGYSHISSSEIRSCNWSCGIMTTLSFIFGSSSGLRFQHPIHSMVWGVNSPTHIRTWGIRNGAWCCGAGATLRFLGPGQRVILILMLGGCCQHSAFLLQRKNLKRVVAAPPTPYANSSSFKSVLGRRQHLTQQVLG